MAASGRRGRAAPAGAGRGSGAPLPLPPRLSRLLRGPPPPCLRRWRAPRFLAWGETGRSRCGTLRPQCRVALPQLPGILGVGGAAWRGGGSERRPRRVHTSLGHPSGSGKWGEVLQEPLEATQSRSPVPTSECSSQRALCESRTLSSAPSPSCNL